MNIWFLRLREDIIKKTQFFFFFVLFNESVVCKKNKLLIIGYICEYPCKK